MRRLSVLLVALAAACAASGGAAPVGDRGEISFVPLPEGPPAAILTEEMRAVVGKRAEASDRALFSRWDRRAPRWSRSPLAKLDFSGVAFDRIHAGTLITENHVVFASHLSRQPGAPIVFVTRRGEVVERFVADLQAVAGWEGGPDHTDVTVARLDMPVPSDVAVYPLLSATEDQLFEMVQDHAPVVATNKSREVSIVSLGGTTGSWRGATPGEAFLRLDYGAPGLNLADAHRYKPMPGDSGNPSFFVLDGRLVLASHYSTSDRAGRGPSYAYPPLQAALAEAISLLDERARRRLTGE